MIAPRRDEPVPGEMRAMVPEAPGEALRLRRVATPRPGEGQVLLRVLACGVCRTDLHVVDGDLDEPKLPLILPYRLLWEERSLRSVANPERRDGREYLARAAEVPVETTTRAYPLEAAGEALADLREGRLEGAAVLVPGAG